MMTYIGNSSEVVLPDAVKISSDLEITNVYTLFKAIRAKNYESPAECHSAFEFVYIVEGVAGITASNRIYKVPAGHICFHPTMEFHKLWAENNEPVTIFVCTFDIAGNLARKFKSGVFKLHEHEKNCINAIIGYLDGGKPEYSELNEIDYINFYSKTPKVLNSSVKMLESLFAAFAISQLQESESQNNLALYTKIISILEQGVEHSVSITEISKKCNISPTTVKNIVKKYTGCTTHKFFLKIKIRKAIQLIENGMSVGQVSDVLGFCNPNYFSQVFYRETGKHASDYK